MEIERKFLISKDVLLNRKNGAPDYKAFPGKHFTQGYLNTDPVVRVRREGEDFFLTYKSHGQLAREEYNLPLDEASFTHLLSKCDGNIIDKTRYFIPADFKDPASGRELTIELDIFEGDFSGLIYAEIEFDSEETAKSYTPPEWFGRDVTYETGYSNSSLSRLTDVKEFMRNISDI